MSDARIRQLQRYIQENPEDYIVWGEYVRLGIRNGLFDPNDWRSFTAWATGQMYPIKTSAPGDENWYDSLTKWQDAEDRAAKLLHNIRNSLGQYGAQQLKEILDGALHAVYREPPETSITYEYGIHPIVELSNGYRIVYDEQNQYIESDSRARRGLKGGPRSVADETPQYLIETDIQYGGSYWQPPDSETIILRTSRNIPDLLHSLCFLMEEEKNLEACYDPRDEMANWETETIDYGNPSYRRETFRMLAECLEAVFKNFRCQTQIQIYEEPLHLTFEAGWLRLYIYETITGNGAYAFRVQRSGQTDSFVANSMHQVITYAWRTWLGAKLRSH